MNLIKAIGLLAVVLAYVAAPALADDQVKRGEYLVRIMDCNGCHSPGSLTGKPDMGRFLAGESVGFELPGLGIFYPRNLTPDVETGLGSWSEADIITAIRAGERPDGRILAPIMPWMSYGALTDEDANAIAAYLKSLSPVSNAVPPIAGPGEKAPAPYLTVVMPQ